MCELELEDKLQLLKEGLAELATEIGDTQIQIKTKTSILIYSKEDF